MARHPAGKGNAPAPNASEASPSPAPRPVQQSSPPTGPAAPERSQLGKDGHRRLDSGTWYRVRTGDSLWSIAAAASRSWDPELLVTLTKQIHELNRAVIGSDPDLILPGQLLRLPSGLAG